MVTVFGRGNSKLPRVFNNWGLKLLSLGLAIFFWFYVHDTTDPTIERVFHLPLETRGVGEELVVVAKPSTVSLTLAGRKSVLEGVDLSGIRTYVDLGDATKGLGRYPVQAVVSPDVVVVRVDPIKAEVRLDMMVRIQLPLTVELSGEPAKGFVALKPTVVPGEVVVSGPKELLASLSSPVVKARTNDLRSSYRAILPIRINNEEVAKTGQITIDPPVAEVLVPIVEDQTRKEVAINPEVTGSPAPGYRVGQISVFPSKVLILGSQATLKGVSFLRTKPIDVSGSKEEVAMEIGLAVPSAVAEVYPNRVTVVVKIIEE